MPLQYTFGLLGPFRVLALENFNVTLFYNFKKSLYHYTIPFTIPPHPKLQLPSFTH